MKITRRGFFGLLAAALVIPKLQPVNISVPFTWSAPPSPDKVAFIQALLSNAIESHDSFIEDELFGQIKKPHQVAV